MLAKTRGLLEEPGLEEGMLALSNTMHRMTADIVALTRKKQKCHEIWSMYLMLRTDKGARQRKPAKP